MAALSKLSFSLFDDFVDLMLFLLDSMFKQQFSVFLEIRLGEKVCRNMYNVV